MDALITFRAGRCDLAGTKVKPVQTPGYIYLYIEDDILHFSWRQRSAPTWDPELDLIMFPGDCTFRPYLGPGVSVNTTGDNVSPTNGRIFELRFSSSAQRHYFWLQSKSQHKDGKPGWFSKRDLLLGDIVSKILTDEQADIAGDLAELRRGGGSSGGASGTSGGDGDAMEDVQGGGGVAATSSQPRSGNASGTNTSGQGQSRGNPPASDTGDIVQNFLRSLQGSNLQGASAAQQQGSDQDFTSLPELFSSQTTVPFVKSASPKQIDALCSHLPPSIFLLSQEADDSLSSTEPTSEAGKAAIEALSIEQKREILERVLRSPQLYQSLGSLTVALRDGGLPQIGEALGLDVENGGIMSGGSMPVGGGEAVKKFLDGVKRSVPKK